VRVPTLALLIAVALPATATAASAAAAGVGEGPTRSDKAGDAVADIVSTKLVQNTHGLKFTVTFAATPEPADYSIAAGGRVCVWTLQAGARRHLCASTVNGRWKLQAPYSRDGSAVRRGRRHLDLTVATEALAVRPGRLRWWTVATPAGCKDDPKQRCADRMPDRRGVTGRIYKRVISGCSATGARQVTRGPRGRKRIALTFDDGPGPQTTTILNLLKANHAPATFFMLGQNVRMRGGALARRMVADGHELANHSWSHTALGGGGPRASSEIARTNAAIRRTTGVTPCLFRPPYGSTGADLVRRVRGLGMTSVLWDVDTNDWQLPGAGTLTARLSNMPRSGSIVLMHDAGGPRGQTVAAVRAALPHLVRRYELVTVSELLGYEQTNKLVR